MLTLPELRRLKAEELAKELQKARLQLTEIELSLKTNQDKKSHVAKDYKKYCAQIGTIQSEVRNRGTEETSKEPTT